MGITAAMVKELRERTGAGMMECKKALVASNADIDVAIEEMRKSGAAKAAKKSGRIAAEGVVNIVFYKHSTKNEVDVSQDNIRFEIKKLISKYERYIIFAYMNDELLFRQNQNIIWKLESMRELKKFLNES